MWAIVGYLVFHFSLEMGLYQLTLFVTYLRPTSLLKLYASDVVAPDPSNAKSCTVLIIAPFEKEVSTKSGYYDETVLMDGDVAPWLGRALEILAKQKLEQAKKTLGAEFDAEQVNLWSFGAKAFLDAWREAVDAMQLPGLDTPYQARHGGASRDMLHRSRTVPEVVLRGFWANASSMRTCHKPGRIQQLVKSANPAVVAFGSDVQRNFVGYNRDGSFLRPPGGGARSES